MAVSEYLTPGGRESVTSRHTRPARTSSLSRSESTESVMDPTPRRSSEKLVEPLLRAAKMMPFQRLPRNSKARATLALHISTGCVRSAPSSL